jgi:predicted peroxiredoxin
MSDKAIGEFYLEELSPGDSFEVSICSCDCKTNHLRYILTTDFKKSGTRMCVCLNTGEIRWIKDNEIVNKVDLYEIVGADSTIQKIGKKENEKNT